MAKPLKTGKKSVQLDKEVRVSRIRRDPVPQDKPKAIATGWHSDGREIWLAILGIVAFALAIDIITIAIGAYWQ